MDKSRAGVGIEGKSFFVHKKQFRIKSMNIQIARGAKKIPEELLLEHRQRGDKMMTRKWLNL